MRAVCGVKLIDKRNSLELMDVLGLGLEEDMPFPPR